MTRAYIYIGFSVWLISLIAAFTAGRSYPNSGHTQRSPAASNGLTDELASGSASSQLASEANLDSETAIEVNQASAALTLDEALASVQDLSNADALRFLAEALALPISQPQRLEFIQAFLQQLAQTDPMQALELANQIGSLRETEQATVGILKIWAKQDPSSALAWANDALINVPRNSQALQLRAIFQGYAETNPDAALEAAMAMPAEKQVDARMREQLMATVIVAQVRSGDLINAQFALDRLPAGVSKNNLTGELVNEWASFDPQSAAAYVESLGELATSQIKTSLIEEWAENDPAAAAAWLSRLEDGDPAMTRAAAEIIREWTRYDLTASAEWLNTLPNSPELDRAVASYTFRAAQEDPESAMSWAESIKNDWMRNRLMHNVAASWLRDAPENFEQYLEAAALNDEQKESLRNARSSGRRDWSLGRD